MIDRRNRLDASTCARALRNDTTLSRCAAIVRGFRPGLVSTEHVEGETLHVDLSLKDGTLLSDSELARLGRSLALQLGFRIVLTNDSTGSQQASEQSLSEASTQSRSPVQEAQAPVIVEPTVYTVLHTGPFSDIYATVPVDILARIHAQNTIHEHDPRVTSKEQPAIVRVKGVLEHFAVTMHEAKVHSFGGLLHIVLDATPDIVEEELFYDLTKELSTAAAGKSVVVTVTPNRMATTNALESLVIPAQEALVEEIAAPELVAEAPSLPSLLATSRFCTRLREEIGTVHPFTVGYDDVHQRLTVRLFFKHVIPRSYEELTSKIKDLSDHLGLPVDLIPTQQPRKDFILNEGKRSTVSDDDMLSMAELLRTNLLCSRTSEWAAISPDLQAPGLYGNCIEITPHIRLTPQLVEAIRAAASLIPAPIIIHRDAPAYQPISASAAKSVMKLLLPPWASIDSVRTTTYNKIRFTIRASRSRWLELQKSLSAALQTHESGSQQFSFHLAERHGKVCEALTQRSDIYRKAFISNMNQEGIISLATWSNPLNKIIKLSGVSQHELHKRYPAIIDRTAIPVSLWDVRGTARAEDGQSFVIKDNVLTHGVHFANAAIQVDQFSPERHQAYRRGDSAYLPVDDMAIASHMFPGLSRYTFREGVVSPAISIFIDYELNALDDPDSIARSIASAQIEPTFIRPTAAHLYPRYPSDSWLNGLSKVAKREFKLMSELGAALTRYSTGPDVTIAADLPDPRHHIRSTIFLANHIVAKKLAASNLPSLYQSSQPPSLYELTRYLTEVRRHSALLPELQQFCDLDPDALAKDPLLLHRMYSASRALPRARREIVQFPHLTRTFSLSPGTQILSGYNPFVPANTGFRKIASLIAQHQLNAAFGLVAPLSVGEVKALHSRYLQQQESGHAEKIERDLRFLGLFKFLNQQQGSPLSLRVKNAPQNGMAEVEVELPFGLSLRSVVALQRPAERAVNRGDKLRGVPVHYSLADNTLLFREHE